MGLALAFPTGVGPTRPMLCTRRHRDCSLATDHGLRSASTALVCQGNGSTLKLEMVLRALAGSWLYAPPPLENTLLPVQLWLLK